MGCMHAPEHRNGLSWVELSESSLHFGDNVNAKSPLPPLRKTNNHGFFFFKAISRLAWKVNAIERPRHEKPKSPLYGISCL